MESKLDAIDRAFYSTYHKKVFVVEAVEVQAKWSSLKLHLTDQFSIAQ